MSGFLRIGSLDIAELISQRLGSYVDMDFIQFVAVEGNVIDLWYINGGGEGPSYHIQLSQDEDGWNVELKELPHGTEQQIAVS